MKMPKIFGKAASFLELLAMYYNDNFKEEDQEDVFKNELEKVRFNWHTFSFAWKKSFISRAYLNFVWTCI